jgi:chromosome segregation ATPase
MDNIDTSRQALDKTKGETDKQITKLNDDISAAQIKLNELESKTDQASKTAATKLRQDLDKKIADKRMIAENTSKTIEGRTADAFAAGGRGLSDYFQKSSTPKEIQLIADIGTAIGTGKGNTPQAIGSMLNQLSPAAIAAISPDKSRLSSASVDWAAANTKNPKLKKELIKLSSALASRGSTEKKAADEAARRDAERKKHVKANQDTNKNIATGGVYGIGKKVGLWE